MKNSLEDSTEFIINNFYSLNYSCLRVAYQDGIIPQSKMIFNRDDVFNKKRIKNLWLNSKLKESATERNQAINEYIKTFKNQEIENSYEEFCVSIEFIKQELIDQYNKVFETNNSFDEVFNGFFCKGTTIDKMLDFFYETEIISKNLESVNLLKIYYEYQEAMKKYMVVESAIMISDALINDISPQGIPNLLYGNFHPQVLTQISGKNIANYCKKAQEIKNKIQIETKEKSKKLNDLIKAKQRRKVTKTEHLLSPINNLKGELLDLSTDANQCNYLLSHLSKLQKRFISANTNYQNSEITNHCEKFIDFLLGIETKCDEFSVDSIYITHNEQNYIDYLFALLKHYDLNKEQTTNNNEPYSKYSE